MVFYIRKLNKAGVEKGDKLAAKKIQAEIKKKMNPTQGKGGDDESGDSDEQGECLGISKNVSYMSAFVGCKDY